MNTKKNGFTLIELLAVIVVLAIIALIATPIILGVIDSARKGAYKSTAEGILKSAENALAKELITESNIDDLRVDFSNNTNVDKLEYKGTKPNSGYISIDTEGNTTLLIHNNDYCAIKYLHEDEVRVMKYDADTCKGQYQESILNGADPVLDKGMIPIVFDGNVAKKADITSAWHDYSNKTWANVVLVREEKRTEYQAMKAGTAITEADVLAYLVWIPRYKYKLFNVEGVVETTPQSIEIVFEDTNAQKSMGITNGEYLTAPGFTLGGTEANGFWVGKFETTGDATTPTIKPNVTSLRNQNVSTQFETSLKFKSNTYGLTSESRMMKNEEWGAVAYLSHSKYGTNTQVRINNNEDFISGCGASSENGASTSECEIKYGATTTYPQSTTGNISGIFDMSGGAWEYVMGVLTDDDGKPRSGYTVISYTAEQAKEILGEDGSRIVGVWNSGYNGLVFGKALDNKTILYKTDGKEFPNRNYYTLYTSTNPATACDGGPCIGSALGETEKWYADYNNFVSASYPWFIRGGYHSHGAGAGVFYFRNYLGLNHSNGSFRVVIQ